MKIVSDRCSGALGSHGLGGRAGAGRRRVVGREAGLQDERSAAFDALPFLRVRSALAASDTGAHFRQVVIAMGLCQMRHDGETLRGASNNGKYRRRRCWDRIHQRVQQHRPASAQRRRWRLPPRRCSAGFTGCFCLLPGRSQAEVVRRAVSHGGILWGPRSEDAAFLPPRTARFGVAG